MKSIETSLCKSGQNSVKSLYSPYVVAVSDSDSIEAILGCVTYATTFDRKMSRD